MNETLEDYFASYHEWHDAITNRCGINLTPEYCTERIRALQNPRDASTSQFLQVYGSAYRDRVIGWFKRAGAVN